MLRGKEIPYWLDGRDNLMEALLDKRNQATIAHHEKKTEYSEPEPSPEPIRYHTYAEFPAFHWK
jgi:hypothetical protein